MYSRVSSRYYLLLSGAVIWILLIIAAPYASLENHLAGKYIYLFFSNICHQKADRCFHYQGVPMAVCARCLGLYLGFILGLLGSVLMPGFKKILLAHSRLLIIFILPMLIDLVLPNNHWSRLVTGIIAAFPVAFFVHQAVEQIHFRSPRRTIS